MIENRVKLLLNKSSLEFLPRLTKYLDGPKIYIKRDDEGVEVVAAINSENMNE
jgi:1-aminocyclopropane-1-carboxylate deaminase/D-cysteine desulfhydrase-like pyridoxal-dependent ACC family enzyme